MKSSTLVILCAALAFSAPTIALAQSTSVDATVGGTVTVDGNGVDVNAGANDSATTDANGNGNGTTDGNGNGAADGNGAANGNGTAAAGGDANAMDESMKCEELGSAASIEAMGKVDMSATSAATNVAVVPVADCDDTTRSALASVGGTALSDALKANTAVDAAIMARGATMADVIGATVSGDTLTVYVESNQSNP